VVSYGGVASRLWIAGETEMAVELLRDAIEGLESGGAAIAAAQYRIQLASILQQTGRQAEVWQYLRNKRACRTVRGDVCWRSGTA
jgi:hypothetical protein